MEKRVQYWTSWNSPCRIRATVHPCFSIHHSGQCPQTLSESKPSCSWLVYACAPVITTSSASLEAWESGFLPWYDTITCLSQFFARSLKGRNRRLYFRSWNASRVKGRRAGKASNEKVAGNLIHKQGLYGVLRLPCLRWGTQVEHQLYHKVSQYLAVYKADYVAASVSVWCA